MTQSITYSVPGMSCSHCEAAVKGELAGVAGVELAGGLEDRLVVTLEPQKLAAAGVSVQQITGVLQANNLTLPAGELPVEGGRIPVSTIGRLTSVEEVRDLVVGIRQQAIVPTLGSSPVVPPQPVTLGDLGTVEVQSLATTGYGRTNGRPAVTISVSKTSSANTVGVARDVLAALDDAVEAGVVVEEAHHHPVDEQQRGGAGQRHQIAEVRREA